MHVMFTHGGVGQYHCNGFIKKLGDNGIELTEWDTWTSEIQIPNYQFIKPDWIIDRFVDNDAAHIKAFASDCIAMIDCISLFVQAVLFGTPFYTRLLPYMKCFRYLKCICDIIRTKSASHGAIRKLRQVVKQHHELFIQLYPQLCKPKLHYLTHIPDNIEKFKTVLTCFSGESLHKLPKSVMRTSYKKSANTTLSASLQAMRAAVLNSRTFTEVYLEGAIREITEQATRTAVLTHISAQVLGRTQIFASRKIRTARGTFANKQCLVFATDNGLVASRRCFSK